MAAMIGDATKSARSIGVSARQNYTDCALTISLRGRAERHVNRWPAVPDWGIVVESEKTSSDSEMVIRWRHVNVSVAQRLIVLRLAHEQCGFGLEKLDEERL
jgi:hypothetical protein